MQGKNLKQEKNLISLKFIFKFFSIFAFFKFHEVKHFDFSYQDFPSISPSPA